MARHRKRTTEAQADPAMDISSMIDCCFLLLIYFLVATSLVSEKKLDISIPGNTQSTGAPAPLEPGRINIKADGSIFWNDDMNVASAYNPDALPGTPAYTEQRHMNELVDALKLLKDQATAANTSPIVIMTGDAASPHQRIVDVMAALAEAGIRTVGLNTAMEE